MEKSCLIRDYYTPPVGGIKEINEKWENGFRTKIIQIPVPPVGERHRCYNCGLVNINTNVMLIK